MAWLRSLGDFPDLAGTVAKLSESVKNIEKNFDSALGLEEKPDAGEASGIWPSTSDGKTLFGPVMAFMGHKGDDTATEVSGNVKSPEKPSTDEEQDTISGEGLHTSTEERAASVYKDDSEDTEKDGGYSASGTWPSTSDVISLLEPGLVSVENKSSDTAVEVSGDVTSSKQPSLSEQQDQISTEVLHINAADKTASVDEHKDIENKERDVGDSHFADTTLDNSEEINKDSPESESVMRFHHEEGADKEINDESQSGESSLAISVGAEEVENNTTGISGEHVDDLQSHGNHKNMEIEAEALPDEGSRLLTEELDNRQITIEESADAFPFDTVKQETTNELSYENTQALSNSWQDQTKTSDTVNHNINNSYETQTGSITEDYETEIKEKHLSPTINSLDSASSTEVEKLRKEMRSMEASMLGAARQAQAKADEIANLMNENEYLRSVIEDLKRKSAEAEIDTLRDEYHQRVSALEKKVYALTKERDTLRREQNRKSDTAALLKEKDEIISQVMSEGEELSKKQAAQELTIRKLRAQIREFEEEKQRIHSKLQVEETKVESIKRDKAATEKLLQETIERNQAELASQKEFYTNALNAAREAESLAEARANNEARVELESRLSEAGERESLLVQTLEELRQTLSSTEQRAVFREDMLQRDIEDLQKRYQASELRYNELITQVPESTKPLLRQIEAMQETSNRRAEAWAGLERALNSRLQEAEAKAADAEERERAMNERLSQSLSRITVLETQIACLRTEQTQLSRSLEKERQRASENRQEYLAAAEEAATQEGRAKQLEDEIKDLRNRSRHDLQEEVSRRELLDKELERERAARLEMEKTASRQSSVVASSPYSENGSIPSRKLSNARSLGGIEESLFLQATLDTSENYSSEKRIVGEANMSPYFLKSMTPSAFEAALRQKDGELASYMSRLTSLESIRDSLAEELVKMTAQCEKLRTEAAVVPSIKAELEALRRRHSSALELMGERDEELEELRADIMDLKEMYREQVDLLVNRLQTLSSSVGAA